ncbi:MAG: serine/threonine protein phosphatase, partial [Oscillospiraceae bacterium]
MLNEFGSSFCFNIKLYDLLKESVPIIDAAINKIIRLCSGFKIICSNKHSQAIVDRFLNEVNVSGVSIGFDNFIYTYLDNLLTYGNAVGEIVVNKSFDKIMGLYNSNLQNISFLRGTNPLDVLVCVNDEGGKPFPVKNQQLILHSALNPKCGDVYGQSILKGLPFFSSILLKIYDSIGQNFERVGNIRYAVTYKPGNDSMDKAYAKERALQIAKEWQDGMQSTKNGQITDFISVGDVDIKVIGADNQILDTNIPVRQILEQIISKLSIPPFLLGLNWSTTERMSKQQCDILTSELEFYRRILTPIIVKIIKTQL